MVGAATVRVSATGRYLSDVAEFGPTILMWMWTSLSSSTTTVSEDDMRGIWKSTRTSDKNVV